MLADPYLVNLRKDPAVFPTDWILTLPHSPPRGYAAFLDTLGFGQYCDFLTVLDPPRILESLASTRDSVATMLDSIRTIDSLPDVILTDLMPIAHSIDGDFVVTSAAAPELMIGVPRQDFGLYSLPDGFSDLLNWSRYGESRGEYVYRPPFRYFESFLDRSSVSLFTKGRQVLSDVAKLLEDELNHCEVRRIDDEGGVLLFARAIDGRIQLTQSPTDSRVGIGITFDRKHLEAIVQIEQKLVARGFNVSGRT